MSSIIEWKAVRKIDRYILTLADIDKTIFNARPNTGLYRQFGLSARYSYIPLTLEPVTGYYNSIQKKFRDSGYVIKEKKQPYCIEIPGIGTGFLSLSFRIFPPNIATATVRFRSLRDALEDVPFDSLFSLRNPRLIPVVGDLLRWSFDLMNNEIEGRSGNPQTDSYFGFHFSKSGPIDWQGSKARFVGLLIGNSDYREMDESIVNSVVYNSAEINKKSLSEQLLLNKQGALFITSKNQRLRDHSNRLRRAMDLAEIAIVYKSFLDAVYLDSRRDEQIQDYVDYVFTGIKAWIKRPAALLNVSYTNTLHWNLLVSEFSLLEKLRLLEEGNPWLGEVLSGKSMLFADAVDRWWTTPGFTSAIFGHTI